MFERRYAKGIKVKRVGYVWEELVDIANCEAAVLSAIRNKRKTRFLRHVKENYQEYGQKIQRTIIDGWEPEPVRYKTINEGTERKTRNLIIPSFRDHVVQTAVAKVLERHLAKRFYFYTCGSLPNRGQTFATCALKAKLKKKPKYAAIADIRHFYQSVKKDIVMSCLSRVFKDKRFLALNEKILNQMGDGLAIGFTVSHWYAHIVLSFIDERIKSNRSSLCYVRFMDNFVMLCGRKRTLHKAINLLRDEADRFGLSIKKDWQVFPVKRRMIPFLSYRFGYEKTVLRKPLMYRMARRLQSAEKKLDAHTARTIMSYRGILKWCDSYNFRAEYLYPNVSLRQCRRLISNADQKRILLKAA